MKRFWKRDEIEDLALVTLLDFRRRTGLKLEPPIDVDLVGELGCGLQWDWDILPEPPSTLVWAALFPHDARVVMNESHAPKFAASRGLERFTKAHEIGHWMLHVDKAKMTRSHGDDASDDGAIETVMRAEYSTVDIAQYIVRGALQSSQAPRGQTNWLERHADWFAAALLMPASVFVPVAEQLDLRDEKALRHLAARFDVSLAATRARLSQLNLT